MKKTMVAAAAVSLFALVSSLSLGATYYVAQDGADTAGGGSSDKPFKTIGYALKIGLKPGDTVAVRSGTYNEQVSLPVGLKGTAEAPITLKAVDGPKTATIFSQNPANVAFETWPEGPAVIEADGAAYLVIDGFVVSGGADRDQATTSVGVMLLDSSYCTVRNCELKNSYVGFKIFPRIGTGTCEGNKCINNAIHDNGYLPFLQGHPKPFAGYGIYIFRAAKQNIVDGCELYDNCAYGICVKGFDNVVRNCKIFGNGRGTKDPEGRPYFANGSTDPAGGGICLNDGGGGLVCNNLIFNNAAWGILEYGYGKATILNNTIYDNNLVETKGFGIISCNSDESTAHTVRNNILLQNRGGEFVTGYNGKLAAFAVEDHNYVDDDTYLSLKNGPSHEGTILSKTLTFLSTDPRSPDFLKPNPTVTPSPMSAGADLSAVFATDCAGTRRPAGKAWDIGAYEHPSGK